MISARTGLLLVVALAACGSSDSTSIELRVSFDVAWHLDAFRVHAGDRESTSDVASTVTLLVPDAWAGQPLAIDLWGLRAGEARAYGTAVVVPRRGGSIAGAITMSPVPCGDWCAAGATSCVGDGVAVCHEGADGCLVWSAPTACGDDAPYCSLGECRDSCVDECATGESRCAGPGGVQTCGQGDSDECLEWIAAEPCPGDEPCSNGACRPVCEDECDPGDSICSGGSVVACGDVDGNGCREWDPAVPCGGRQVCDDGACAPACTDDCDGPSCTGLWFRSCGQYDFDDCADLSPGASCVPTELCDEGLCTTDGCASQPRVCDDPPASECIDDDTLRVYQDGGTCSVDGGCEYDHQDVECPSCPSCDVCDGLTCDDPPDAICLDAGMVRTFTGPGTCDGGACTYDHLDTACVNGCSQGACVPQSLSAGWKHTCAIRSGGGVVCWGDDADGQSSPPSGSFRAISAGFDHSCGIRSTGALACWGADDVGQTEPPSGTFAAVDSGGRFSCALRPSGTLACWGDPSGGEADPPAGTYLAVTTGDGHACAIQSDDREVICWGHDDYGQTDAPGGAFSQISAGDFHTCGVKTSGAVACWGLPLEGQTDEPDGTFTIVSAGGGFTCGVRTSGALACWGSDDAFQSEPPSGTFSALLDLGSAHACAYRTGGAITCWGDDQYGQASPPF